MDLINQFIENYKKKINFYETAGRIAAEMLEDALRSSGIRAMVTSRAKSPSRLKIKVTQRNEKRETPYKNMSEIYADIADLPAYACPSISPATVPKRIGSSTTCLRWLKPRNSRCSRNSLPTTNVFPATGLPITGLP